IGMGSCGIRNSGGDLIAAVSAELYDTFPGATPNPNSNPVCKKTLTAHYQGRSVTVMVTDRCPGCKGKFDLDLSPAAFNMLADPSAGRLTGVEWSFDGEYRKRSIHETHRMVRRKRGEVKL
ncbi:RlpA-like double-psi beta-barrel-protein domain-containing protein-containing protein, partial [Lyophyllum atratum]